ncbi:SsgA family sporulation/cell division regulator [Saccharothrix lopnurensis]|uniref:SsgA family sporulation/cell division regulator n=1 Tax=Saccharothrix lopnurensis TaxID=1670621 RepID=A0ABW1PFU9_9PSEU
MTEPLEIETIGVTGMTGVKVRLVYDPTDPYTIFLYVWNWYGKHWLKWVCERDLLTQALQHKTDNTVTGELDMLVTRVNSQTTKITKITRGEQLERTEVVLGRAKLASFLEKTFTLVPPGQEKIDLNVEQLLH